MPAEPNDKGGQPGKVTARRLEDGQWEINRDGTISTVSETDLAALVQKGLSADTRWEEAAKLRKEADEAQKTAESLVQKQVGETEAAWKTRVGAIQQALLRSDQGDAQAYESLLRFMGLDDKAVARKMANYTEVWKEIKEGETNVDDEGQGTPQPTGQLTMEQMPPQLRQLVEILSSEEFGSVIKHAQGQREKDRWTTIDQELEDALAAEPILVKILKTGGPRAEKLRALAKDQVRGRIAQKEEYGPAMRKAIATGLRSIAEEFSDNAGESTPIPGIGIAPGLLPEGAQADEPVKRVSPLDPSYHENMAHRLARLAKGITGRI